MYVGVAGTRLIFTGKSVVEKATVVLVVGLQMYVDADQQSRSSRSHAHAVTDH